MSKYCCDCEHLCGLDVPWQCFRPIGGISPVTGRLAVLRKACREERVDPTGCGLEGKYFEERT